MTGARQHRRRCRCSHVHHGMRVPRMHSEATEANAGHFVREGRVTDPPGLTPDALRRIVRKADGPVLACNACGRLKLPARGSRAETGGQSVL